MAFLTRIQTNEIKIFGLQEYVPSKIKIMLCSSQQFTPSLSLSLIFT